MKKLLLALICALAFVMPLTVKAETVAYSITFYADSTYRLADGVFTSRTGWSATSRMTVQSDSITINDDTIVHHVLFWDKNNTYIGYGNLASSYENSRYIGDFGTTITFPAGVSRFAFVANNLGVNTPSGLNGYTYDDLFGDPTYLDYDDSTLTATLGTIFTSPLYLDYAPPVFGGDTLDDIATGYSIPWLNYWTFITDGDLLTLTNLIQNGQFNNGETSWTDSTNICTVTSNVAVCNPTAANQEISQAPGTTIGLNYYAFGRVKSNSNLVILRFGVTTVSHSGSNNYESLSVIHTATNTVHAFAVRNDKPSSPFPTFELDNALVFVAGSYTKTQLDAVIAYFGYFPYNTAISVPDVTNAGWTTYSMAYILENASSYNGTLTDLDEADTFRWTSMETDYSITISNPDKAYYWQLYEDAVAEVDRPEWYYQNGVTSLNYAYYFDLYEDAVAQEPNRWEWYRDQGITSSNFATYYAMYLQLLGNYGSGILHSTFDNLTVSYDREDVEPYVPPTLLEGIEDYIDGFGLGTWAYIFISVAIMIVFAVILGLLHAPMMVMLIVEGALFLLFTIFGWFPVWLVIMVVIILFAILYKLLKGDGQSA